MNGPTIRRIGDRDEAICTGCLFERMLLRRSGTEPIYDHYCSHPQARLLAADFQQGRDGPDIGVHLGTTAQTPHWCPVVSTGISDRHAVLARDLNGHELRAGDHVRTPDGLLWIVAFNDPHFPREYGCQPFLLYHSAKLDELGERLSIEHAQRTSYASDQPNVYSFLLRDGFLKPCAGGNNLSEEMDASASAVAGDRRDCGCKHQAPLR